MKAVLVMFDSLNRHFLETYGCDWTKTPNFTRLAQKTCKFNNFYAASLPCMPARKELHTGRLNFLHRSWGPMEPYDFSVPEELKKNNIYSHLITDHHHYWEDGGCNYHTRYSSHEFVRGQEGDPWKCNVKDPYIPHDGRTVRQDLVNRLYINSEESQPQSVCFSLGLEFLEKNKDQDNWFLQLETFDPHEPFYSMQKYKDLYSYCDPMNQHDWPNYKNVTECMDYIEDFRKKYAALLTMCDVNLGKILDFFDQNNMWEDTMLIINTDHGFLLGEHDCWAKCVHPFYNEVAHIPFFIWDPRSKIKDKTRDTLAQTIDIAPTLLDFFNLSIPKEVLGKNLKNTILTDENVRDAALFGIHGGQVNITDGKYVYMRNYENENKPLYNYTLMPTHMRGFFKEVEFSSVELYDGFSFTNGHKVMKFEASLENDIVLRPKVKFSNMLFDINADPQQMNPISDNVKEDMFCEIMAKIMLENDCPYEQFERLGLESYLSRILKDTEEKK